MTREEAIEILIAVAVCCRPILSCDFCSRYVGTSTMCEHPNDKEIEEAVLLLKGVEPGPDRTLELEELRGMVGRVIWWRGEYCVCKDGYVVTEDGTFSFDWVVSHGKAYRHRPKEDGHA